MLKKQHKNLGFTLIELLISVTIMLILLNGAIAYFLDYLNKRSVSDSVDEVKTYLQRALSESEAGNLGGCDQLNGYKVASAKVSSVTTISLQADCNAGIPGAAITFDLPKSVDVSPNLNYIFKVLHAGVDLPGGVSSQDITVSNEDHSYVFTIYREGRFSAGDWL